MILYYVKLDHVLYSINYGTCKNCVNVNSALSCIFIIAMKIFRVRLGCVPSSPMQWGEDLQSEHEQFLVDSCGRLPVFITDYPASTKAFYARANDHDSRGQTVMQQLKLLRVI